MPEKINKTDYITVHVDALQREGYLTTEAHEVTYKKGKETITVSTPLFVKVPPLPKYKTKAKYGEYTSAAYNPLSRYMFINDALWLQYKLTELQREIDYVQKRIEDCDENGNYKPQRPSVKDLELSVAVRFAQDTLNAYGVTGDERTQMATFLANVGGFDVALLQ